MAFPIKKIYRDGSPGHERARTRLTLAAIKKDLAAAGTSHARTLRRRYYESNGLLGRNGR